MSTPRPSYAAPDPQAMSGRQAYPPITCACDHPKGLHVGADGRCQQCDCKRFEAGEDRRCEVCGAHLSAIEVARRDRCPDG